MKEEFITQLCISPQWNVHLKTFLCTVPVILCLILQDNTVDAFQTRGCEAGLFLHVNPETRTRACCITVPLPKGYQYVRCEINGTHDRIEKCPEGLYQVDNTTTASEAKCTSEIQCNPEENVKISDCDAQGHCIFKCVCNYDKGYCGPNFYDCQSFPVDCPKKWVQKDCSCKWKPTAATRSALGNATNKPGQKIINTPSTISANEESKPTEIKDRTPIGEDDDDKVLLTVNNNGTQAVPDQKLSVLQQYKIIIIVIFAVGIPACIAGLVVYCWKSKRKREYQSVEYSDGPSDNSNSNDGGGSSSNTDNTPDSAVITQATEKVIGYRLNGADNGAGYGVRSGSRKLCVAIVRPQPMDTEISFNEQDGVRGMSMEGYSDFTWSLLDNPTDPHDEETDVLKIDDQQEQQSSEGVHLEELQQVATSNMEDDVATDESL